MSRSRLALATLNLANLNRPGLPIYADADGLSPALYDRKLDWLAGVLRRGDADVWGFQELWHAGALADLFERAGLSGEYDLLAPPGQAGQGIVNAAAVRRGLLAGEPEWVTSFPDAFELSCGGDDGQTCDLGVFIRAFSRPVLRFAIDPREEGRPVEVFVAHFKSKRPTRIDTADWYDADPDYYRRHREGLGYALSAIRRTAEAAALRMLLTDLRAADEPRPAVVLGDLNGGAKSDTLAIVGGQPNYLTGLSTGGSRTDLYSAATLQRYRSERDVYYTYIYQGGFDDLDHVLVTEEFYDNARRRLWRFDGAEMFNDHLTDRALKESGASDHAAVVTRWAWRPA